MRHQQSSKRKEAEIERNRAIARKKREMVAELKSEKRSAQRAPLIFVLPQKRHKKVLADSQPKLYPRLRRSPFQLRQERESRWGKKAMYNPFLRDVLDAFRP